MENGLLDTEDLIREYLEKKGATKVETNGYFYNFEYQGFYVQMVFQEGIRFCGKIYFVDEVVKLEKHFIAEILSDWRAIDRILLHIKKASELLLEKYI